MVYLGGYVCHKPVGGTPGDNPDAFSVVNTPVMECKSHRLGVSFQVFSCKKSPCPVLSLVPAAKILSMAGGEEQFGE